MRDSSSEKEENQEEEHDEWANPALAVLVEETMGSRLTMGSITVQYIAIDCNESKRESELKSVTSKRQKEH